MTTMNKFIDISYPLDSNMVIYPGNPGLEIRHVLDMEKSDSANVSLVSLGSHTGTHIDAPAHFIPGGSTIDEIPLDMMCGRAKVIDVTGVGDIEQEIIRNIGLNEEDIVLFKTDTSLNWSCDRIMDDYVTLSYDASEWLAKSRLSL